MLSIFSLVITPVYPKIDELRLSLFLPPSIRRDCGNDVNTFWSLTNNHATGPAPPLESLDNLVSLQVGSFYY